MKNARGRQAMRWEAFEIADSARVRGRAEAKAVKCSLFVMALWRVRTEAGDERGVGGRSVRMVNEKERDEKARARPNH